MPKQLARCWFLLTVFAVMLFVAGNQLPAQDDTRSLGIFEGHADVGSVTPPGTLTYDAARGTYTITSAGANLWSTVDAYHFAWKKVSGDVSFTADINFPDSSGKPNPHRKAILIFRQSLDADSVYVDAAQHGSGLMALQYRRDKGATTQDIELDALAEPKRLRLEKRGDTITMLLSMGGEPLHQVGASIKLHLDGPFYAGIGVCSHDASVVEKAVFSNVELQQPEPQAKLALYSTLQTIQIDNSARVATVVHTAAAHFEAPNWSRDGSSLIFNQDGRIWKIAAKGGVPAGLEIGAASRCNGSHGFSPDGKWLAISCSMPDKPGSRVYVIPAEGGTPRLVTENPNSYWHSWSPDGATILFTRPSKSGGNIYAISAAGGEEKALTTGDGLSDDPDYSPDGQYIYFNSDRSGAMEIWRMKPDGSGPEQITFDDLPNWTPHISPDGKSMVFISYQKGVTGHPTNQDIALRIMSLDDRKVRVLVDLKGGAGTMNVPAWSPDSRRLAFVSYQMLPEPGQGSGN